MVPKLNDKSQNQHTPSILAANSLTSNISFLYFDCDEDDKELSLLDISLSSWVSSVRDKARELWVNTRHLLPRDENGNIYWCSSFFNLNQSDNINDSSDDLATISPRDKPWDGHRATAEKVEKLYSDSDFDHYSKRMSECSQVLSFGLVPVDDELKFKLRSTRSCHIRHCPVCQWRRSLMWKSKAHKLLPAVVKDYPKYRWLFLTLTIRNMPIENLKSSLKLMKIGFERLSKVKAFPGDGWIKSLEVTRGSDGSAHPHYHCLLMVKPSYFSHGYIKHDEWVAMWKKAMRLDYEPSVDVKAIPLSDDPVVIIPEMLKYTTKPANLTVDKEWLIEYTHQMQNVRCVSTAGILKEYLKELEKEPEDLIGNGEEGDQVDDEEVRLNFSWRTKDKKYKLVK